jgi:GNAT superfamily N-acetyltransferase
VQHAAGRRPGGATASAAHLGGKPWTTSTSGAAICRRHRAVAELHAAYTENWSFGVYFEARIATELAAFMSRYDDSRDGFWTATVHGRVEGSLTIDGQHGQQQGAWLRWFISSEKLRGRGVGDALLARRSALRAVRFPLDLPVDFEGLHAAHNLYQRHGFILTESSASARIGV